jgi:hypothetical protein
MFECEEHYDWQTGDRAGPSASSRSDYSRYVDAGDEWPTSRSRIKKAHAKSADNFVYPTRDLRNQIGVMNVVDRTVAKSEAASLMGHIRSLVRVG